MSMARRTFPSRLELNRPEGSSNAAPLANVILTTFLYVSPVQTMPPWDQTGVPIHFHSSTISGSALWMIARTFASIFPRQSPSSLIFASINTEADSTGVPTKPGVAFVGRLTGTGHFMDRSFRTSAKLRQLPPHGQCRGWLCSTLWQSSFEYLRSNKIL